MSPLLNKYLSTAGKAFADAAIGIVAGGLVAIAADIIQRKLEKINAEKEK